MSKSSRNRQAERGSALFYILIGIVLFAALSYSVSSMMSGGSAESIGQEQAKLFGGEVLDYGRALRGAIQDMKISNGCGETEISFETGGLTGYTNGTNTSCQVYHNNGGDMNYIKPATEITASDWIFVGSNIVAGVGTAAPDLIAILPNIKKSICDDINLSSGLASAGSDTTIDFTKFAGSYASTQTLNDADGKMAGCLNYANSGDNYFFYQVLIPR